ncbi:calmodulin-A-like [Pomacea canaliculata]|nr:calmodulin-A-like [Pomacea canaliculata]
MASSKKGGKTEDVYLNAFKQFDKNGDGYISLREMREVLTAANSKLTDAQIYEFFMYNDSDKDQKVSFEEFVAGVKKIIEFVENAREFFKQMDTSGDGYLDKKELRELLNRCGQKLPEEDLNKILQEADKNRDNKISFDEFIEACT